MLLKKHNKEFEDLQDRIKLSEEEFNRKKKKQETPLISKFKNKINKLEINQKNEMNNLKKTLKEDNEKNINEKNKNKNKNK